MDFFSNLVNGFQTALSFQNVYLCFLGCLWGTMVGVIFLGIIMNGMTLLNVSEYWQHVVRGALILLAVLINRLQQRS